MYLKAISSDFPLPRCSCSCSLSLSLPPSYRLALSQVAGNDTRAQAKIRVTRSNLCHDWFIAQVMDAGHSLDQDFRRIVLRVWLYTYPAASVEEQSGSACHPSKASQRLTREYQHLGERPRLQTSSGKSLDAASVSWDEERSCWSIEFNVNAAVHRHRVQLDGQHIGVLGCHVRPRAAVLAGSASLRNAGLPAVLSAVQGATDWLAVGCGEAGSQPPTVAAVARAPTSPLNATTAGTLSLRASDTLSVAYDRCGAFGVAATLLLQDHSGIARPEAILLSETAAEATRVLTLPQHVRSAALAVSTEFGCEVVLAPQQRWSALTSQSATTAALLVVACGQQILVRANDTWTRVATPWEPAEQPPAAPSWSAHVRSLSSCASIRVSNSPILAWKDEPVAAGGGDELPLYITSDNVQPGSWEQITALISFADNHVGMKVANASATWTIQSATVMESVPHLIVALQLNLSVYSAHSTSTHLFVLDRSLSTWTASTFVVDSDTDTPASTNCSCDLQMAGTSAGTSELYVWGAELWYSLDGGLHFHRVTLLQADGAPVSHGEASTLPSGCSSYCIRSVVTSEDGQIVARTREPGRDRMHLLR